MDNCIFCKIVKGEIPCAKILEDDTTIAFLDINPASRGHVLVVPKKHSENIHSVSKKELENLIVHLQKVANAVKKVTGCDGINVMQNNGRAAGQIVMHVHFHVIPRVHDDGLELMWKRVEYADGEMETIRKEISCELEK